MAAHLRENKHHFSITSFLCFNEKLIVSLTLFFIWLFIFLQFPYNYTSFFQVPTSKNSHYHPPPLQIQAPLCDPEIAPFYIYDLPDRFNAALLRYCENKSWPNLCPHVLNRGLGYRLRIPNWYATNQFASELIFHAIAETHPCRTYNPNAARLFYIPFYSGLYVSTMFREPNFTRRDALGVDLVSYLSGMETFRRHGGHDHFVLAGRIAFDFMRCIDSKEFDYGANRFLCLPELSNVSALLIERSRHNRRPQIGIPYPSYFHPKSDTEIAMWQDEVRKLNRTHLFAFLGGPRVGISAAKIRSEVFRQCGSSEHCLLVDCKNSPGCFNPLRVIDVMKHAQFCLHPPGDTATRRSVFDSVLTGCVPVFFSEHTAYTQYQWYLPERPDDWSVLIGPDELDKIEEVLKQIPKEKVDRMREVVIGMMPRVTYMHPNATRAGIRERDAVDVALVELSKLVRSTHDSGV